MSTRKSGLSKWSLHHSPRAAMLVAIAWRTAAERLPRLRLGGARDDHAARGLAVGQHLLGKQADLLADDIWCVWEKRLHRPVAVAIVGPRRRAVGLAGGEPGEAAVLVVANARQRGMEALHDHAAQERVRAGQRVAARRIGFRLRDDGFH